LLEEIDRRALFHEMHRTIEETATVTVRNLMRGSSDLTYPPNCGLSSDEIAALQSLKKTPAMETALRKVIADAAAYPIFHLLSIADGVADPPDINEVSADDQTAVEITLHDGFYESYWAWRRRRPDPGWRLDTYAED
jgi:hypothetical protein